MQFGVFYEHQLPKPWSDDDEFRLLRDALDQVELADRLGFDYAWEVEHHFLDEYSHSSAPEVFLAAAAARTTRIRLGHGIRQVIPNYNHPARTAEGLATLDLISDGRVDFGIGEGATRMELHGFDIPAKQQAGDVARGGRADRQHDGARARIPATRSENFSLPCRNVIPKPRQKPHPPMWIACTNRETIKVAARHGLGALAFSFIDPEEAHAWVDIYYDIIKSEECVPLGHTVNANIALVTGFSLHDDRAEAIRRGHGRLRVLRVRAERARRPRSATRDAPTCGASSTSRRAPDSVDRTIAEAEALGDGYASCIGSPADAQRHLAADERGRRRPGHLHPAGRPQPARRHLRLARTLRRRGAARVRRRRTRAPGAQARRARSRTSTAALARKQWMQPLAEDGHPDGAGCRRPGADGRPPGVMNCLR